MAARARRGAGAWEQIGVIVDGKGQSVSAAIWAGEGLICDGGGQSGAWDARREERWAACCVALADLVTAFWYVFCAPTICWAFDFSWPGEGRSMLYTKTSSPLWANSTCSNASANPLNSLLARSLGRACPRVTLRRTRKPAGR